MKAMQITLRPARTEDFDYCVSLYFAIFSGGLRGRRSPIQGRRKCKHRSQCIHLDCCKAVVQLKAA